MPRPKRTRRAPAHAAAAAVAVAVAENQSSPAPASGSDIYSHSDREHSVIRKEHEEAATKGLSRSTRMRQRQGLKDVESASGEDTEAAKNTKEKAADGQQKSEPSVETGMKTRATPVQQRRDTTGLDMDDDDLFGLDTTLDDDDEGAAAPPSAPRSDTSNFSVSNFRRRGRAPSISINKDDAPIRPSSRGISTPGISSMFNIGNFRRRQREPSILGTAQKERPQRPLEPSSQPGSGDEDEDEDDFNPEAESTPLNNRRRTQPSPAVEPDSDSEAAPVTDSQQVLAPDSQPEREAASTYSSKSRKRKSTETHDDDDRPGKASRTDPEPKRLDDDSDSSLSDLPSPVMTPPRVSNVPRPVTPNQDEIMAPPESSGSEDNEAWPDIRTLAKQRRRRVSPTTPNRDGNISDASSPPSLTHSPNFPATRKTAPKKQQKKVTTADLTNMLPQRRHRKSRDAFDMEESEDEVETSDLAQDDDELSYADTRTRSRRPKTTPLNRSSANRPASRGSKAAAPAAKPRTTSRSSRPSTRTYGRRLSDKENHIEDEDEETVDAGEGEGSFAPVEDETLDVEERQKPTLDAEELKRAASKFKEVDRWELEYEEVTQSSSPNRDGR